MKNKILILLSCCLWMSSCQEGDIKNKTMKSQMFTKASQQLPQVEKKPKSLTIHGDERIDNYYWLNERENDDVIQYLKDENSHAKHVLSHTEEFQQELYDEMVARIKKDDISVPYKRNGYYYSTKYSEGNEYPIYTRGKSDSGDDEIVLDQNILAEGHSYHAISGRQISPNNNLLIYGEDTLSRRIYTLNIKDLNTGKNYVDKIPNTSANAVWANDNKTFFYTVKDDALRPYKVFRHVLGTPVEEDVLIYHEADETFNTYVMRSNSNKYVIIGSYATLSSEFRVLSADDPMGEFKIFQARERDLEYEIEHVGDQFYILTNKDAQNFQLMTTPQQSTEKSNWKTVIAHRPDVFIEDFDVFKNFMALTERHHGISKIRIITNDGEDYFVQFDEDVYSSNTMDNYDFDVENIRLYYSSLKTPSSTYDFNTKTKALSLLKRQEVLGDFSPDDYETTQVHATARDGVKVPISLVYKKGFVRDGSHPLQLIGYGSYGSSYDPTFSSVRLSLIDRGFVLAIAHIRGGQELGRQWYEDGKLFKKKNTFTDFIDCAEYLVEEKYADPSRVFAYGGSAGGLLMGAITNMKPALWGGVVSAVPFVDVVTTMLDESIPLTTGEYDEWGNPNEKKYYEYMKSYSPVDNIEAKNYPPILVTTGLHDSQVQYWEPAKYVAKLRDYKTDDNPLLFHTNLEAGHGGASGRFARLKEWALQYAFILDLADEKELVQEVKN